MADCGVKIVAFHVYVIKNNVNNKIYIGQTSDINKRLLRHNNLLPSKKSSYTRRNKGLWIVVYKEEYGSREEAIKRERELKSFKGREYIRNVINKS